MTYWKQKYVLEVLIYVSIYSNGWIFLVNPLTTDILFMHWNYIIYKVDYMYFYQYQNPYLIIFLNVVNLV